MPDEAYAARRRTFPVLPVVLVLTVAGTFAIAWQCLPDGKSPREPLPVAARGDLKKAEL